MSRPQFVLASASPARRQLLINAGIQPFVCPSQFDEAKIQISEPVALVKALSQAKAEAVAPQFQNAIVLGCDSVLAFDGIIYGKPETSEIAIRRWQQMRGRIGELHTGHTLVAPQQRETLVRSQVTRVFFAQISDQQIADYIATSEPMNCAGAFTIDGKGSLFIEKLEGCHTNVIGLSMPLLRTMLDQLGYSATEFW